MKYFLSLILLAFVGSANAQSLPKMLYISGGTEVLGGGYQFAIHDYYMVLLGSDTNYAKKNQSEFTIGEVPEPNNPERQVTVAGLFMSETEITNAQYREFLMDSLLTKPEKSALLAKIKAASKDSSEAKRAVWLPLMEKAGATALLPDTSCWVNDFQYGYHDPMVRYYYWHPAFDQYPVVGVSWDQANAYCSWLSVKTNRERLAEGKELLPHFRLPTEGEWEYAAKQNIPVQDGHYTNSLYPWVGHSVIDEKGKYRANIKTGPGDYIADGYEYTAPVKTFAPNSSGLYEMSGNVAEWCMDVFRFQKPGFNDEDFTPRNGIRLFEAADATLPPITQRVVKGGSWADYIYGAMAGSRMGWPQTRGGSRIGFRVAMTQVGCTFGGRMGERCPPKLHKDHLNPFR